MGAFSLKPDPLAYMKPIVSKVILIDGTVGSGKSTVLEYLRNSYSDKVFVGSKLTTRSRRSTDNNWEFTFVDDIPVTHHDFSFESVGKKYAVNLEELEHTISTGLIYVVSCVDKKLIQALKERYGVKLIYVFRPLTDNQLEEIFNQRNSTNPVDKELRLAENRAVGSIYLDKISLFDHVVLNIDGVQHLKQQIDAIFQIYI